MSKRGFTCEGCDVVNVIDWIQKCDDVQALELVKREADARLRSLAKKKAGAAAVGTSDTAKPLEVFPPGYDGPRP